MKAKKTVAVVTADIIDSSAYRPSQRQKVDDAIRSGFTDAAQRFPGAFETSMAFRITAGDEFQIVIGEVASAFNILTYIRAVVASAKVSPFIRFRASIGVGTISVAHRSNPYENDGQAFVRSRRGLEELSEDRGPLRWTKIKTGKIEQDAALDAILCLLDFVQESWTIRQWEAIRWSLLGSKRLESAKKLRIRHQNVSKRLKAAGWSHFDVGASFTGSLLERLSTQKRVQKGLAP